MESPTLAQISGIHSHIYEALYKQVDPTGTNHIKAYEAANFLKKSGLSGATLGKIWDLSDPKGKGFLDKTSLFVALKLIALVQNGRPPSLSDLTVNVPPPKMGESIDWSISQTDRQKYKDMFNSLNPSNGKLAGNKVKPIMIESKLPVDVLTKIWDLSDMDQDGFLDLPEFSLAMHLISKAHSNVPMPSILPPELINIKRNSSQEFATFDSTTPPLVNQMMSPNSEISFKNPPLMSAWVVSAADKAKFDEIFQTLDTDFDGYVNGFDVKNTLVQSGLSHIVLAHIWNLCDIKQNGRLNSEQFGLAMYFIEQKQLGLELPQTLSAEMVPPTLRPKPSVGIDNNNALPLDPNTQLMNTNGKSNLPLLPSTGNKELDDLSEELRELQIEKSKLETELNSDEANVKLKDSEIKSLQNEIEALHQMLKQLDSQKSEARKRLDDLAAQKRALDISLHDINQTLLDTKLEVDNLSQQLTEQKTKIESQENELSAKRKELEDLKSEEHKLESQLEFYRRETETASKTAGDTQLEISQFKTKIMELEEYERRVCDAMNDFDSALTAQDLVKISNLLPRTITPPLIENQTFGANHNGFSAFDTESFDHKSTDFKNSADFTTDPFADEDPFKEDPFKSEDKEDPFSSIGFANFSSQEIPKEPFDPFGTGSFTGTAKPDPFGSDPFASKAISPPNRSESPTPALPPKKSKAPPPRPAPPKNSASKTPLRAAPAPPTHPSSGDTFKSDPFGSNQTTFDAFNDNKDPFGSSSSGNFANFANFDEIQSEIPPPADPYATLASIQTESQLISNTKNIKQITELLERIDRNLKHKDTSNASNLKEDLKTLLTVLQCPLFSSIITIQESIDELKEQLLRHPSILPVDFDISPLTGQLLLNVPPEPNHVIPNNSDSYEPSSDPEQSYEFDCRPELIVQKPHSIETNHFKASTTQPEPDYVNISAQLGRVSYPAYPLSSAGADTYSEGLLKSLSESAAGRNVHSIQLYKPDGHSLGFSVVGMKNEVTDELGIYIQDIHLNGIAARDGRLEKGDQILAIDGQPFSRDISHEEAINILQRAHGIVELVIARGLSTQSPKLCDSVHLISDSNDILIERSPSGVSDSSKESNDMVLNTEWSQIEAIELDNDGSGLGFGIIGGKSSGVVIKTILPGGVADRDNRLQSGDHILQINDINLRGMGSDQVAQVLRQTGAHVRLIVARPVDPTSDLQVIQSSAPIVPTRSLSDAEEVEKHLALFQQQQLQEGSRDMVQPTATPSPVTPFTNGHETNVTVTSIPIEAQQIARIDLHSPPTELKELASEVTANAVNNPAVNQRVQLEINCQTIASNNTNNNIIEQLPEMETFEVELVKDQQGLGITIAGYVCEKEEISGIFIKSIATGSVADVSKRIAINDQIIEVDGRSLYGYTNHQAVEVLRNTGKVVKLRLARYLRGSKYEQLQQAIADPPASYYNQSIPGSTVIQIYDQSSDSMQRQSFDTFSPSDPFLDSINETVINCENQSNEELRHKWEEIIGDNFEILIANIIKFKESGGLGISLEGTVDVENGSEVRPHHYIRSILPDGPVGVNGVLKSGDELLEVNGTQLHGLSHSDVVPLLKDLPMEVQMVCARLRSTEYANRDILVNFDAISDNHSSNRTDLDMFSVNGSLTSIVPSIERLVKAKSDGSLAITTIPTSAITSDLSKMKSRSLEPLTGLAMWNSEPQIIELIKGDRGLGFSILDYQDPMNPTETVIVIRSLVPGGVAQQDGRLIPGDRLLFVNDIVLENASLDLAVSTLKCAPKGKVVIGVAKPLPLPESNIQCIQSPIESQRISFEDLKSTIKMTEMTSLTALTDHSLNSNDKIDNILGIKSINSSEQSLQSIPIQSLGTDDDLKCSKNEVTRQQSVNSVDSVESQLSSSAGSLADHLMASVPIERYSLPISSSPTASTSNLVLSESRSSTPIDYSSSRSPSPSYHNAMAIPLPAALERTIKIVKGNEPLGLTLELADRGVNGMIVKNASKNGAVFRDARIQRGDYLLAINSESLRNITNSKARAILRRAQLIGNEITFKYIPSSDADVHKQSALLAMQQQTHTPPIDRASPSLLPLLRRTPSPSSPYFGPKRSDSDSEPELSFGSRSAVSSPSSSLPTTPSQPHPIAQFTEPLETRTAIPSFSSFTPLYDLSNESFDTQKCLFDNSSNQQVFCSDNPITSESQIQESKPIDVKLESKTILSPKVSPRKSKVPQNLNLMNQTDQTDQNLSISCENLKSVSPEPSSSSSDNTNNASVSSTVTRQWGEERVVQLLREDDKGLGISIVGGKVEMFNISAGSVINGIFIKNILSDSPAGREGTLKSGDRLLEVDGVDLRDATHDKAVDAIKNAKNPIKFVVQSLLPVSKDNTSSCNFNSEHTTNQSEASMASSATLAAVESVPEEDTNSVHDVVSEESDSPQITSSFDVSQINRKDPKDSKTVDVLNELTEESDSDLNGKDLTGKIRTSKGIQIDRASAANFRLSATEVQESNQEDLNEDEFGYSSKKILKKYGDLNGYTFLVDLHKGLTGLGISLAGNRDRTKMSVFVCGLHPKGSAFKDGRIQIGDEILEVNGIVVQGRCHLNASAIIKSLIGPIYKIIVLRRDGALNEMAVKPLTQFPVHLEDDIIEEKYSKYKGVRTLTVRKSSHGLGIMIIEGKHSELGRGVFVSDIQEGSPAELAGLSVGDMILCVNLMDLIGSDYETAASALKNADGLLTLVVAKPMKTSLQEMIVETEMAESPSGESKKELNAGPSATPSAPPPTLPKPQTAHKSMHGPIRTSTATNGSLSRANQKTIPAHIPKPQTYKSHLVSSNLVSGITSSTNHSFFTGKEPSDQQHSDLKTCEIRCGRETNIEIVKDKLGLGLSIVGGSDTPLNAVIIHEVYPDGAAALDGRLKPGDQILEVNGEDLREAPHEKAIVALRQTPPVIKLTVFRENGETLEEDFNDIIEIDLNKKSGRGLGLSIVGRKNGSGVFISEVVKGGIAESDSRLMIGDQILEVNGQDLRNATQEYAAAILKTTSGKIHLKIGRLKAGSRHSNCENLSTSKSDEMSTDEPSIEKEIILERGSDGLGFSIVGGYGGTHGHLPIYVKNVFEKGAAAHDGRLQRGDLIVSVNDTPLEGLTHEEAVDVLKSVSGTVKLNVLTN